MPTRVVWIETETAEETTAIGEAIERLMRARYGGNGEGRIVELRALPAVASPPAPLLKGEGSTAGDEPAEGSEADSVVGFPLSGTERGSGGEAKATATAPPQPARVPALPAKATAPQPARKGARGPRDGTSAAHARAARATEGGGYPCPEPGCDRSFSRPQGLGRHRLMVHGTPGQSHAAKARRAGKPMRAGLVQAHGLTPDAQGRVQCPRCEAVVHKSAYGSHAAMHDRREATAGATPAGKGAGAPRSDGATAADEGVRAPMAPGQNIARAPFKPRTGIPMTPARQRQIEQHGFSRIKTPPLLDDPRR